MYIIHVRPHLRLNRPGNHVPTIKLKKIISKKIQPYSAERLKFYLTSIRSHFYTVTPNFETNGNCSILYECFDVSKSDNVLELHSARPRTASTFEPLVFTIWD